MGRYSTESAKYVIRRELRTELDPVCFSLVSEALPSATCCKASDATVRSPSHNSSLSSSTGGGKFAGYEFFKKKFVDLAGGPDAAVPYRTAIYLGGSAAAEFFADILLTPCEATRIRLVSQKGYASGFLPAFARMAREGGLRELYAG